MLPNKKTKSKKIRIVLTTAILAASALVYGASIYQPYSYKEPGMPAQVEMSPKLKKLFLKTKEVCFGRYILEVPAEAKLTFGHQEFPAEIVTHKNAAGKMKELAEEYISRLKNKYGDPEVTYLATGPIPNSLQLRYFASTLLKPDNVQAARNYVTLSNHVFEYGWGSGDEESIEQIMKKMETIAHNLRLRDNAEVPKDPGVCIDEGFIADSSSNHQEIFAAGISLPSIPDIRFSVMSNKNASTEGPNGVGLIARHERAMSEQGIIFPGFSGMARLRMGNHIVNGWNGEEVLLRRNGKQSAIAHEFLWQFVGTSGDMIKPASIDIELDTGVDADTKFATRGSLTDDEAVALWDKLVTGIRFRK